MKANEIVYKFAVGDKVVVGGKEATIEARSYNINLLPIYRIGELWYFEHALEEWIPPCPV